MRGSDIAKKIASKDDRLALVSVTETRFLFQVPIGDVVFGMVVDQTSSASENLLRPFAFPLASGKAFVVLDSTFDRRNVRFDPRAKDCMDAVFEIIEAQILPWIESLNLLPTYLRDSDTLR